MCLDHIYPHYPLVPFYSTKPFFLPSSVFMFACVLWPTELNQGHFHELGWWVIYWSRGNLPVVTPLKNMAPHVVPPKPLLHTCWTAKRPDLLQILCEKPQVLWVHELCGHVSRAFLPLFSSTIFPWALGGGGVEMSEHSLNSHSQHLTRYESALTTIHCKKGISLIEAWEQHM